PPGFRFTEFRFIDFRAPRLPYLSPLRAREGAAGQAVVCRLLRGSSPTRGVAPKRHRVNGWLTTARRRWPCSKRVRWPLKHPLAEWDWLRMFPRLLAPKPIWLTASRLDLPVVSLRHR